MNIRDSTRHMVRAYPGGVDSIAPRIGKSPKTLEKELLGSPGFKLGAEDAHELQLLCHAAGMPQALVALTNQAAQLDCLLVPMPPSMDVNTSQSMEALAKTSREAAELIAEGCTSLADGKVSDNELKRYDRALAELVVAGQALRSAMAAINEAGKPRGES
jgi:hypothetical protein